MQGNFKMIKAGCIVASTAALLAFAPMAQAKGCLKGAAIGGVAGHVAGHHAVLGAVAGCAVGHHAAAKKDKEQAQQSSTATPAAK